MSTEPGAPRLGVINADLSRRGFLTGAAAGAGLLLAGCGGGKSATDAAGSGDTGAKQEFTGKYEGPTVALAYWNGFTGGDGPHMRKMVQDFNASHDNIKVSMNTIQWADYYQKVPAAVLAKKGPDVGIMHVEQLATFAARRIILPLDDVATQLKFEENDFIPAVWKAGIYKDKRYGIPLDVHSLAQYYNTTMLAKGGLKAPPESEPEFGQALDKLSAAGVKNPFWMPTKWPAHLMFMSLLWQFGGEPYSADGSQATFNSDAGKQALTWMADQVKKGRSPQNVAIDTQYTAFKTGRDAITWDGIWQILDLQAVKNLKWSMSPIPKVGKEDAVWANGHNFVLYPQTDPNKTAASKVFIDYISKQSLEWAKSGMIPARNSVRASAEFKKMPQAKVAEKVDSMRFLPSLPGIGDVGAQTLELAVNRGVLGQQSPAAALDSYAAQGTKLMQANQKKFGA